MPNKDNGVACTLRNISKAAEDRAHFISLAHVGFLAHICLYRVKDNQPHPVLDDSFLYALVGEGKLPRGFINDKHPVKVGFGFYQAELGSFTCSSFSSSTYGCRFFLPVDMEKGSRFSRLPFSMVFYFMESTTTRISLVVAVSGEIPT